MDPTSRAPGRSTNTRDSPLAAPLPPHSGPGSCLCPAAPLSPPPAARNGCRRPRRQRRPLRLQDLLYRRWLRRRPDLRRHCLQVPADKGHHRRREPGPHRGLELGRAAHLRARAGRRRQGLPRPQPLLLHRRRRRHHRGRPHLRFGKHPHKEGRPGQRLRGGPHLHRGRHAPHCPGRHLVQDRRGKVDRALPHRRRHAHHPRGQLARRPAVRHPLQPRVPGGGHSDTGPVRAGPRAHWLAADARGHQGPEGPRGRLRQLGAAGPHHHDEPVVLGALQAGRQRAPGPADQQHQLAQRAVRGHGCGCRRGRVRLWPGLAYWAQVPQGLRRVRRFLLPEGHPQPGLALRVAPPQGGGRVLAPGRHHQRVPEEALRRPDRRRAVPHRYQQEDRRARLRLQEEHGRHPRVGGHHPDQIPHAGDGQHPAVRPQGRARADHDGPQRARRQLGPGRGQAARDHLRVGVRGVRGRGRAGGGDRVGRVQGARLREDLQEHEQARVRVRRAPDPGQRQAEEDRVQGRGDRPARVRLQHGTEGSARYRAAVASYSIDA